MRLFKKVGLFLGVVLLAGCSTLSAITGGGAAVNAAGQLVVEEATALAIQSNCAATTAETVQQCYDARGVKVLAIAQQLENATTSTVVAEIPTLLNQLLSGLNLTPAEVTPLHVLVSQLTNYLTPLISSTPILTSANLAIVQQVAGWVADEAALYAPTLTARAEALKAGHGHEHGKKKK